MTPALCIRVVYVRRTPPIHYLYLCLTAKAGDGLCSLLSPSYIQWDAMTFFCECVISQILRSLPKEVRGPGHLGGRLTHGLQSVLTSPLYM